SRSAWRSTPGRRLSPKLSSCALHNFGHAHGFIAAQTARRAPCELHGHKTDRPTVRVASYPREHLLESTANQRSAASMDAKPDHRCRVEALAGKRLHIEL